MTGHGDGMMGDGMMGDGMMGGWMTAWMSGWVVIAVAVLAVAVFAVVRFSGPRPDSREEAHELLRRRYAAGEIDRDEYTSRQVDLGRGR